MELDLKGNGFYQDLFLFRKREELETAIIKKVVRSGMNVMDLGANIGYYTLLLSHLVGPNGKVFAIDPLPQNIEKLKNHLLINNIKNVQVNNLAISDETGRASFFVGTEHNLGSLVEIATQKQSGQSIKVETISLSDYFANKPKIDLIRMDIERGELSVFKNLIEEWPKRSLQYPKLIMFEVHPLGEQDPDPAFTPLLQGLSKIGYRALYTVSSANPLSKQRYRAFGYMPQKTTFTGQSLYRNIKPQHLISIAARRPKFTRAILLVLG